MELVGGEQLSDADRVLALLDRRGSLPPRVADARGLPADVSLGEVEAGDAGLLGATSSLRILLLRHAGVEVFGSCGQIELFLTLPQ